MSSSRHPRRAALRAAREGDPGENTGLLLQELKDRLKTEGFERLKCYSFNGDQPPIEGYILEEADTGWLSCISNVDKHAGSLGSM
jgi:hypothetical protein